MSNNTSLPIILVSGACCMPHMARLDSELEKKIRQAAGELGIAVDLRKVSLGALLAGGGGLSKTQSDQILALFQAYGAKFAPALLLGDEVCFAGAQPGVEQIKERLKEEIGQASHS